MESCIFCKIVRGEIPAQKVYEDESVVVFRDIAPQAPVHLLAIPRQHIANVHEIPADRTAALGGSLFAAIGAVVLREGLTVKGYRLVVNSGKDAGQAVPHLHVHILSGRAMRWPPG